MKDNPTEGPTPPPKYTGGEPRHPTVVFRNGPLDQQEMPALWDKGRRLYADRYQFNVPLRNGQTGFLVYVVERGVSMANHGSGGLMVARFKGVFEENGVHGRVKVPVPKALPMPGEGVNRDTLGLEFATVENLVDELSRRYPWVVVSFALQHAAPPMTLARLKSGVDPLTLIGGAAHAVQFLINNPGVSARWDEARGEYVEGPPPQLDTPGDDEPGVYDPDAWIDDDDDD